MQAIVGDLIPARGRARYQAYLGIVATLGIIAGPLLGGLFADDLSWRWIFYVNVPIGVAALVAIAVKLELPARTSDRSVDMAGALLATLFTTSLLLAAVWGRDRYPWGSPQILGLGALAVAALLVYVLVERRAAEPITPPRLFASGIFSISSALFFLATLVLFVAMLYVPSFMQSVHRYSAFGAGMFLIPLIVGLIAATAVSGQLISRTGRYKIYAVTGSILSGGGMLALSRATPGTPVALLGGVLAVTGAGLALFIQVALLAGQNAVGGAAWAPPPGR